MTDDSPLDRRLSNADAAQLLLAATPAISTGATILGGTEERDSILSGFALVGPDSTLGRYIVEQKHRNDDWDNQTRWTLIDSGPTAKVILEIEEVTKERYALWKGVISFEYPDDRHALAVASQTGWLAVAAGDPDTYEGGKPAENLGELVAKKSPDDPLFAVELSTHPQLREMLRIMDSRNPVLEPIPPERIVEGIQKQIEQHKDHIAMKEVHRAIDTAISDLMHHGMLKEEGGLLIPIGPGSEGREPISREEMHANPEMLLNDEEMKKILINAAVKERLLENIDDAINGLIAEGKMERIWVGGEERFRALIGPDGNPLDDSGLLSADELVDNAMTRTALEKIMGFDNVTPEKLWQRENIDTGEITYIDDARVKAQSEGAAEAYISLLHKKTPVWAGARGFAMAYEEMLRRVRIFRELGSNSDQLTILHCQTAISMFESHVLTIGSEQVNALPNLAENEAIAFLRGVPLPFNPMFIDFSGDDHLPSMESIAARGGTVRVLGVQMASREDQQVVYFTPVFLYTSVDPPYATEPVTLGSLMLNLDGDDPSNTFYWLGQPQEFGADSVVSIAWSPMLDRSRELADEYARMVLTACGSAISVLHLLDFSNIEIVEKSLERRERKRAEKRNWNIPLTIRVSRPSRRVQRGESDGMSDVEWTHQWDVIGHPMHFSKVGPMTRCIVCAGKTSDEIPCSRCNNTGLDPEKVAPCTRIDVKTGELTCPNGCRRIWCPSHTKGPPDAPYKPKTRKIT